METFTLLLLIFTVGLIIYNAIKNRGNEKKKMTLIILVLCTILSLFYAIDNSYFLAILWLINIFIYGNILTKIRKREKDEN